VISKLISGSAHPDEKLIRKLEKKLNIKLREAIDA
jgi:ribosome-binding protein aMBF1 (putative translation factor)